MKNLGGIEIKQLIDTMILDLIPIIEQEEIDKNKIPSKLMKELSKVSDVSTKKCMHSICITEFSNHLARREGQKPLDKSILATKALLKYFNIELIEDVTRYMIFEIITAKEDGVIEIPWEIMEKAGFTESDIDNLEIIVDGEIEMFEPLPSRTSLLHTSLHFLL